MREGSTTLSLSSIWQSSFIRKKRVSTPGCDIYSRKGMKEKATEACKSGLEIDPDLASAQKLLKKLLP
jgi:hypothetical protein